MSFDQTFGFLMKIPISMLSSYFVACLVISLRLFLFASEAQAVDTDSNRCQYEQLKSGHPDGILKRYCGRQIAQILGP